MSTVPRIVGAHMTSCPYTIGADQTLARAASRMRELQIRHLPVLDGGRLVGVVSERDLVLVESLPGVRLDELPVSEAMSEEPYTVDVDAPLLEVVQQMADRKLGSALVTADGELRGVFTTIDALNALAELLGGERR